jgi:hypothetical protein
MFILCKHVTITRRRRPCVYLFRNVDQYNVHILCHMSSELLSVWGNIGAYDPPLRSRTHVRPLVVYNLFITQFALTTCLVNATICTHGNQLSMRNCRWWPVARPQDHTVCFIVFFLITPVYILFVDLILVHIAEILFNCRYATIYQSKVRTCISVVRRLWFVLMAWINNQWCLTFHP